MTERAWWEDLRDQMPVVERWAYFDHAATAPITRAAHDAVQRWATEALEGGTLHWRDWNKNVEEARRLGAALIGAHADEIAIVHNTTEGINLVAEGFPWREGDNVVTLASEFPSNLFPWKNLATRGVEARVVPVENERVDLARVAEACDSHTRVISVSWVGYATGWRNDVAAFAELAHSLGALLFLDAIQGLGVFPLDVSSVPVDFLAADGHKWMLGPEGAGLFYCRREHLDRLRPLGVGWNSVVAAGNFTQTDLNFKPAASRYEGGSHNMAGIAGFAASLGLFAQYGTDRMSRRLLDVTDTLCERLQTIGATIASDRSRDRASGIVACEFPGADPLELRAKCRKQGVVVNARAGRLRVSPHAYTNDTDIDRLIDVLRGMT